MAPESPIPNENEDRLLPKPGEAVGERSGAGPIVGIAIILVLLVIGALYFWGAALNSKNSQDTLPLIPPDNASGVAPSTPTQ